MKTGLRDNNKGFSLIEILVVIAIMVLMMGMFLASTNIIGRRSASQCQKQLKHELDQVRIASMGKNQVLLHLFLNPDNKIMVQQITRISDIGGGSADLHYVGGEIRQVGSSRVRLDFLPSPGSSPETLDADGIYFEFNRSTGAFKNVNGSVILGNISADISGATAGQISGDYKIKEIYMTGGGITEKLILHPITGKVTED